MELALNSLCGEFRGEAVLRDPPHGIKAILKTSLLRIIRRRCGHAPPGVSPGLLPDHDLPCGRSNECFFTMSDNTPCRRQAHSSTNSGFHGREDDRPRARQPSARNGGARRDRTDDLMLAKHALSQLSYGPVKVSCSSAEGMPLDENGGPGRT